jgi:hypothetical protein
MTDIVERLRKAYGPDHTGETPVETLPLEAADEIDRLRDLFRMDGKQHANHIKSLTKSHEARISKYAKEFERLRRERDEARSDLEKHKTIAEHRNAVHRSVLLRDIEAALNGDLGPIRNRRDLMLLPPVKWVLSEEDRTP